MAESTSSAAASSPSVEAQLRTDRRAQTTAQAHLTTKLGQLGVLAGLSSLQVSQASLERGGDAFRQPASNAQRLEAYELATRLEATLPNHAGTALSTRAALAMFLFDPGGADRLTEDLRQARRMLGN